MSTEWLILQWAGGCKIQPQLCLCLHLMVLCEMAKAVVLAVLIQISQPKDWASVKQSLRTVWFSYIVECFGISNEIQMSYK